MKTNALVIMDGFGYSEQQLGNAVLLSGTPNINKMREKYAHTMISASGRAVGLPEGQMGNSEVGHLNLGAGRVVYQDITMIDKSIEEKTFFDNQTFLSAIENCKKHDSAMHLVGLCSDGGVHSHIEHLFALIKMCGDNGLTKVYIHCIADGRDVPPDSARKYVADVEAKCAEYKVGTVATVIGRYYYMDRDNRWDRVKIGYDGVFAGIGTRYTNSDNAVAASYAVGEMDEFIKPLIIGEYNGVNENDSMIFYNYRSDRAREISRAIIYKDFNEFERSGGYKNVFYVGMTQYDETFSGIHTAFAPKDIKNTLGEYLAKSGKTQARVAETEKYAHVTFFFNGGVEEPNAGEQRILVSSPAVATYDMQPEMSAYEVCEKALDIIGKVDVLILNFANCDMVGHTGVVSAATKACSVVDECVAKITAKIMETGGSTLLTADHGNAETMCFENGSPCTSHTTNPVELFLIGDDYTADKASLKDGGKLADIAPTLLTIMGLEIPSEMDGDNLIG